MRSSPLITAEVVLSGFGVVWVAMDVVAIETANSAVIIVKKILKVFNELLRRFEKIEFDFEV